MQENEKSKTGLMIWGGSSMYLRMLKRDLVDKIGLNITIFIFMILAFVLVTVSSLLLFTSLILGERTYVSCNSSDITIVTTNSISDKEGQREKLLKRLEELPEYSSYYLNERMIYPGEAVNINKNNEPLSKTELMYASVQTENNTPFDMHTNQKFILKDGCIAIPHNLLNNCDARIGDIVRVRTQMGNVYEFTISTVYQDPSAYVYDRILFSDKDYEVLLDESPNKNDVYEVYLKEFTGDHLSVVIDITTNLINEFEEIDLQAYGTKERYYTNDGIMGLLVAIVFSVISIFMIGMIFVTIHFSLKSAIKREEKEIGIMKAIGVYSFSYRALFAVKYIFFALVGGIIGIPIAFPLAKIFLNQFMIHILLPTVFETSIIVILSIVVTVFVIIAFTFNSLRRMNKISVMDVIHGENKGERFKKIPGLFLNKKKHIGVPLFLAVNDILSKVKRYVYLILAYVAGISMILLVVQIKDSVCGPEYAREYLQIDTLDFYMDINDKYYDKLYRKEGSETKVYAYIKKNLEENGVPAKVEYFDTTVATLKFEEKEQSVYIMHGISDPKEVIYIDGGKAPTLYNEVALAYLGAKDNGVELGDIVSIEFNKYCEDNISFETVTEEFVVTAFFDGQCWGTFPVIMGKEFEGAVVNGFSYPFKLEMDCEKKDYDIYYKKMDDLYTDDEIRFIPKEEALNEFLVGYDDMFTLMLKVVSIIVAVVLMLLTVLYQNIFIEDETADIAMLKSLGFHNYSIKLWQHSRIMILAGVSVITALIFIQTIGHFIIGKIVSAIIHVVNFTFVVKFIPNFVIVPLCFAALISIALIPVIKIIDTIQIWRVRNE